jgi:predicted dehydrogenase
MSAPLRAAVVGVGRANVDPDLSGGFRIGYVHAKAYLEHPDVELVAGADINPENLAAWQQEFGVPTGHLDYREMLETVKPDIVSICTYVGLHAQILVDCANAGVRGVFCEKPFLAAPAEIAQVREAVAATGMKVSVAHIRRHLPVFRRTRELVESGAIGSLLLCSASLPGWDLSEWGSHWLDIFRFFNSDDDAVWVMGQARVRDRRGWGHAMEEHAVAYFGFANGCRAVLDAGGDLVQPYLMILTGSDGELRLQGSTVRIADADGVREETLPSEGDAWDDMWGSTVSGLVDWVGGGDEPTNGLTNALAANELYLGAYLSVLKRDRVDLPLDDLSLAEWPLEQLAVPAA